MEKMKKIIKFRVRLNLWQSMVFLLVMSLALCLFLFLMQPLPFFDVAVATFRSRGLNFFLNWLPIFLPMIFLYFVGAGAANSSTIVGAVWLALGFANRTKILLRGDPLVPWDLLLGGEVAGIAHSFGIGAILAVAAVCVLYVLAAVAAAWFIRSEKIGSEWRMLGVAACVIFLIFTYGRLYNNVGLNADLYVRGNIWNQVNQFNSRGFVYSFIHTFNTNRVMRPEGYDRDAVLAAIERGDTSGFARLEGQTHPHIIMIMGEAFSELSNLPHFDFTDFDDPLENWNKITPEGIHGEVVVSVLGGGTAQTEFDVLTGLNARHFPGAPFAFRMLTDEFPSMASLLNELGYHSEFMHPGFDWFYNRRNVYRWLGFERLVFIDEFEGVPTKGWYIKEYYTINRTLEMFADHRAAHPGVPYFNFTVTIQNHGPYVDKYLHDGPVTEPNFSTNHDLPDIDINALSNYFHGLRDVDIEFARLVDYLRELEEPTVLVYFSDHLPAFTARIYDTILPNTYLPGSLEDMTRTFRVPFLIWMNPAALELYDVAHPAELAVPGETLLFSSSFLGAYVMEILGFRNLSPFWDFNAELRRNFPVVTETRSFAPCGTPASGFTEEEIAPLWIYRD
ncbi:MAG: LTA synthase family protein, partial [Defluviitaleaceae bacterium]|nr:LTA synthase family protein [Defluviitaleaceae bacterium]